jgi:hypothetical protein
MTRYAWVPGVVAGLVLSIIVHLPCLAAEQDGMGF